MRYWLIKSEPADWSWDDQLARGDAGQEWTGVRNYLARNHMREMVLGDRVFFYHSKTDKAIVGIVEVCATAHPDSSTDDPRWDCVDVRALHPVKRPVPLSEIKADPRLAKMSLVTCHRLSVQPVTPEQWAIICDMAGVPELA